MSDDTTGTSKEEQPKRKRGKRKAIYVMVPKDIDDLSKSRQEHVEPEEPEGDDTPEKVVATKLASEFHIYVVPGGVGQKDAIMGILSQHNVDLRNIDRVRMFKGEKKFRVETQYNIRF